MGDRIPLPTADYQRLPHVVARVREFCGLTSVSSSRCVYVTGMGTADGPHATWRHVSLRAPDTLEDLLASDSDVARSLWDTGSLLVYVDLDDLNSNSAGEVFVHPVDTFLRLEVAYQTLLERFDALGMPMLDLMTGAGYSFVGRVALGSVAVTRLSALSPEVPPWHGTHSGRRPAWTGARIDENEARAFHGLGLVLEHLAHGVLARAAAGTMPVVLNNTEVGAGPAGRECASIDLTHMGDPLDVRHVRVAFGLYQKHRLRPDVVGPDAARMPPLVVVPRRRRALVDVLDERRNLARMAAEAEGVRATIPDVEAGLSRALNEYEASDLAAWHREFHSVQSHPRERWPETYARLDPASLPPCVAACLHWPNDLLLRPTHIQLLVRALLARGWHARHIAGLVRAHYEREGLWGDHWQRVDPATRADFDVRVFAGLVAMGRDQGVDFNCVSTQEKGMCPAGGCTFDLRRERERMLRRVAP